MSTQPPEPETSARRDPLDEAPENEHPSEVDTLGPFDNSESQEASQYEDQLDELSVEIFDEQGKNILDDHEADDEPRGDDLSGIEEEEELPIEPIGLASPALADDMADPGLKKSSGPILSLKGWWVWPKTRQSSSLNSRLTLWASPTGEPQPCISPILNELILIIRLGGSL